MCSFNSEAKPQGPFSLACQAVIAQAYPFTVRPQSSASVMLPGTMT